MPRQTLPPDHTLKLTSSIVNNTLSLPSNMYRQRGCLQGLFIVNDIIAGCRLGMYLRKRKGVQRNEVRFLWTPDTATQILAYSASYGDFFVPNVPIHSVSQISPHFQHQQFKSALAVPAASPSSSNSGAIQAVQSVLQNEAANSVLQNVVENQDGGPHMWSFEPFYCCKYVELLSFESLIMHLLTRIFQLNSSFGWWIKLGYGMYCIYRVSRETFNHLKELVTDLNDQSTSVTPLPITSSSLCDHEEPGGPSKLLYKKSLHHSREMLKELLGSRCRSCYRGAF